MWLGINLDENELERISITIPSELLRQFDDFYRKKGYTKRSEAVRDAIRQFINEQLWIEEQIGRVFATITLIYNHHKMKNTDLVNEVQHKYLDIIRATMHIHIDHERCLEVIAVEGDSEKVKTLAKRFVSMPGCEIVKLTVAGHSKNSGHEH